jgi:hypothetical protein
MLVQRLIYLIENQLTDSKEFGLIWGFVASAAANNKEREVLTKFRNNPTQNHGEISRLIQQKCAASPEFLRRMNETIQLLRTMTEEHRQTGGITRKKVITRSKIERSPVKRIIFRPLSKNIPGVSGGDGRPIFRSLPKAEDSFASGGAAKKKPAIGRKKAKKKAAPKTINRKTRQLQKELVRSFIRASMDHDILILEKNEVEVTISLKELKKNLKKASASALGLIDKEKKITICIRPILNIKVWGEARQVKDPPTVSKPVKLKFLVSATHEGICHLSVDVWQGQVAICTLALSTNCVKKKKNFKKIRPSATANPPISFPQPIIQLKIFNRENGRNWYYDYELTDPEKGITDLYSLRPSNTNRDKFISSLYNEIENLWNTSAGDSKQFQKELRNYGATLFIQLFPNELQQYFYENVDRIKLMQLFSTEPFIPWELLVVRNPDMKKPLSNNDKFLGELGLTRWLHGPAITNTLVVRKKQARYIIPQYANPDYVLPGSMDEVSYLEKNFAAKAIAPDPLKVDAFLRKPGSFDLLHFCCHGTAETKNIMASKLMLMEKANNGQPTFLTQTSIEQCGTISDGKIKPIVVLNACQSGRLGKTLTSYGGFANAFLNAGAGAFVGTLWSIEDASAVTFISTLYDELRKGNTLSQATVLARKEAAKKGDATWIAYVIYGSPFAVMQQ